MWAAAATAAALTEDNPKIILVPAAKIRGFDAEDEGGWKRGRGWCMVVDDGCFFLVRKDGWVGGGRREVCRLSAGSSFVTETGRKSDSRVARLFRIYADLPKSNLGEYLS